MFNAIIIWFVEMICPLFILLEPFQFFFEPLCGKLHSFLISQIERGYSADMPFPFSFGLVWRIKKLEGSNINSSIFLYGPTLKDMRARHKSEKILTLFIEYVSQRVVNPAFSLLLSCIWCNISSCWLVSPLRVVELETRTRKGD